MLEQVLRELRNWFVVPGGVHTGAFTVEEGSIALPFLQNGQYFRICGSVFNDGLYRYPAADLVDERFDGAVWALAIPRQVISLADQISAWQTKNGEIVISPYTSESFGGYSYTKASTESVDSAAAWQGVFRSRLDVWRKI